MKKSGLFVILACVVFLIWTMSCQSPSSADSPSSSAQVENNQSNATNDSGSSDSGAKTNMGFLRLKIKDAPIEGATNIYVTISDIRVHKTGNNGENWFTIIPELTNPVDLLTLKDEPLTLPDTELPPGTYNQFRMTVNSGSIVFLTSTNPAGSPLKIPSKEIKTNIHFDLEGGKTIQVTLDFEVENSIHIVKKGKQDSYILRPVVNAVEIIEIEATDS